jgi:alkylation response protein AidB-like acyl-CoA dehydrogenase
MPWPKEYYPETVVCGYKLDKIDSFHEFILIDELNRTGAGGIHWGIIEGTCIGLPPVIKFGDKQLRDRIVGPCLNGEKFICLAITEPSAGSDVAGIQTTAVKTPDGKHYIVNGLKKWITNGIFSDYFTTAVRTGGKGHSGISMLVIERKSAGVSTRKMKC